MKRTDIKAGGRYAMTRSKDLFGYRDVKIVQVVDTEKRYEISAYAIPDKPDGLNRWDGARQREWTHEWFRKATIDQRFPVRSGGNTDVLIKEFHEDEDTGKKTFTYHIVPTRSIRMTEADYAVAKAENDRQVAAGKVNSERLRVERAAVRHDLCLELSGLDVVYTEDRDRNGGLNLGGIHITSYGTNVDLSQSTLLALLRHARANPALKHRDIGD